MLIGLWQTPLSKKQKKKKLFHHINQSHRVLCSLSPAACETSSLIKRLNSKGFSWSCVVYISKGMSFFGLTALGWIFHIFHISYMILSYTRETSCPQRSSTFTIYEGPQNDFQSHSAQVTHLMVFEDGDFDEVWKQFSEDGSYTLCKHLPEMMEKLYHGWHYINSCTVLRYKYFIFR